MFKRHVISCPDQKPIHYAMDNLSTHRGYPFCKTVAELSNVPCPKENEIDNLEKRVQWLTSEDKRIVIHFTPYHGSWLNLVEFWFDIMNKKVLNESYGSGEELLENVSEFWGRGTSIITDTDISNIQIKAFKQQELTLEIVSAKNELINP